MSFSCVTSTWLWLPSWIGSSWMTRLSSLALCIYYILHSILRLIGKSHGQRSLAGCSPWGLKELDMTEWLTAHAHSQKQSVPVFDWLETRFLSRTSSKVNTSCVMMVPPRGGLLLFPGFHPPVLFFLQVILPLNYNFLSQNTCFHFHVFSSNKMAGDMLLFSCSVVSDSFCDPVDCSTPCFPVLHHLLGFAQVACNMK